MRTDSGTVMSRGKSNKERRNFLYGMSLRTERSFLRQEGRKTMERELKRIICKIMKRIRKQGRKGKGCRRKERGGLGRAGERERRKWKREKKRGGEREKVNEKGSVGREGKGRIKRKGGKAQGWKKWERKEGEVKGRKCKGNSERGGKRNMWDT